MKIEWLSEARNELRELLHYYQTNVGKPYAQKFMNKTLHAIEQLADFPEMGVLKYDTLMGKYGVFVPCLSASMYASIKLSMILFSSTIWQTHERIISSTSLVWNNHAEPLCFLFDLLKKLTIRAILASCIVIYKSCHAETRRNQL